MKKEYQSLEELLIANLDTQEDKKTQKLINRLKIVKKRGYFTKKEFLLMSIWKSPRPKNRYLENKEKDIIEISKKVLSTNFEKRKINLLTKLKGVSIPTASAILTLVDPDRYGVIDIRVWQLLYLYGSVKEKPHGINISFNNWYNYLIKLRYWAKKMKTSARCIERTLFLYHKKIQEGNLYS